MLHYLHYLHRGDTRREQKNGPLRLNSRENLTEKQHFMCKSRHFMKLSPCLAVIKRHFTELSPCLSRKTHVFTSRAHVYKRKPPRCLHLLALDLQLTDLQVVTNHHFVASGASTYSFMLHRSFATFLFVASGVSHFSICCIRCKHLTHGEHVRCKQVQAPDVFTVIHARA